jgi:hypothetical protein
VAAVPAYRTFRDVFGLKPGPVKRFLSEIYETLGERLSAREVADLPRDVARFNRPYYDVAEDQTKLNAARRARRASGSDKFSDLMSAASQWNPTPDESLQIASEAVRTGRLGGKKLSSAQRRELGLTNKVIRDVLEGKEGMFYGNWRDLENPTAEAARRVGVSAAEQAQENYPGLLSRSLTGVGGLESGPGFYRKDIKRLVEGARKRAVKAEGDFDPNQLRIPGAPPSRTSIVNKIARVIETAERQAPRYTPAANQEALVAQGRRGWIGQDSYLAGKSSTLAKQSGVEEPGMIRRNAPLLPDELLPALREMPRVIDDGGSFWFGAKTLDDPVGIVSQYDALTSNQKGAVNKLVEQTGRRTEEALKAFMDNAGTLSDEEASIVISMSPDWTESVEDLINFARIMAQ